MSKIAIHEFGRIGRSALTTALENDLFIRYRIGARLVSRSFSTAPGAI